MKNQKSKSICPRCGLQTLGEYDYCPACGFHFFQKDDGKHGSTTSRENKGANYPSSNPNGYATDSQIDFPTEQCNEVPIRQERIPIPTENFTITEGGNSKLNLLSKLIGWRKLSGVVIAIDPAYMARAESNVLMMLIKAGLVLLLFPVIVGVAIGIQVAARMISPMSILKGNSPGFLGNLISQLLGFVIMGRLLGPKEQVTVRDVRLKAPEGREWLVRIRGELYAGNLSVGDDVTVEGFDRHGTLMFRRGSNARTGGKIIAKYR